ENALRARQLQLDLALRTAKAAYWEYDPADRTHQLVPNYYAMLGYSEAGAPRGRSEWLQLVHPDDIAVIEAAQALGPHDDADHRYEFRIRAADGSWRWLLSSFRAVDFDPQGRPLRLLGIDTDITESKEAELALQRERDRAQTYLDVAGVIMTVLDAEHRITLLNRKGCEILGVTEEEVLGLDWFDTFGPPEERERQRAIYSEFLAGRAGPAQDIEMTMMTRRGEVRLVTWHDILLRDDSGKVIGGLSSGEDITEQRAAERKRDEFRTLIESTAQASPDGILVTDDTGRYLFWNKRLQEMWRLDEAHLEARRSASGELDERVRPFTDLVADPQCYLKEMRRIYAEHGDPAREFAELRLKDGRVLEQFSARVSAGDPPITAVAWIYRDITQAKRRDDELAHSQRLAAVGELSGGMAHELNNLLMVISGGLELIQERAAADPGTAELTGMASTAVRRGADLIRQVLAFARQQPLAPRLTDLNALIAEALTPLPQLLGERIRLEFRRGEPLWRSVIDPGQLQTALVNLALNARDAMADGGRLTIETANRSLDEDFVAPFADLRAGDYVMIAVSDEGCGMAPEIAQRAFEPFFTTKPVGQGTGLGLSMVFGFVKQSGGHVQIESDVGRGTTVRIFLPRSLQEAAAEEAPTASPAKTNGETVLVVEDEAGVSAVACAFFHSLGYKVLEAPDGPRALRILKRGEPIHLLFTNLVLPEAMNGKEVAEAARRLHPAIKVLFASGYPMDTLMTEGHIDAGATLLQKPYRRKDLVEALQRLGK
ncbi:MAG TPA: PAS domain S-box protein, partial [Dongiaceae bacterium]|nr:PAS domain S-box protein [Dongiaceae bacterium]